MQKLCIKYHQNEAPNNIFFFFIFVISGCLNKPPKGCRVTHLIHESTTDVTGPS